MGYADKDIASDGFIEGFERRYPAFILETLLSDRTTGLNIIWASGEYEALGDGYAADDQITVDKITGQNAGVIKPRVAKELERQSQRTKSRAEVFTPSWLCNQMNNDLDAVWFGRRGVFTSEGSHGWTPNPKPVTFPKTRGRGLQAYIESPRLEIACGEAPFACSRYDAADGSFLPVRERIGFLDRKLRVVSERAKTLEAWTKQALRALAASYGYEYQGDSLLIARINVFETFCEHCVDRWGQLPPKDALDRAAQIVSWNFWQMNGLTDAVPTSQANAAAAARPACSERDEQEPAQLSLFDLSSDFVVEKADAAGEAEAEKPIPFCVIYDWQEDEPFEFASLKNQRCPMGKKFYAVIGNPPYQENTGDTSDKPIYNYFMDECYKVADKVELITPGRFLFNAGKTPKDWNRKMLADPHLKVLNYEQDSSKAFPNIDIKGGVAVTLRDSSRRAEPIIQFIPNEILRTIMLKVRSASSFSPFSSLVNATEYFNISEKLYVDHPEFLNTTLIVRGKEVPLVSEGHKYDLTSNILDKNPSLFYESLPRDGERYRRVYGRQGGKRVFRYIKAEYLQDCIGLEQYKVIVAESNNNGSFGETLVDPIVGDPDVATTQTFITIGFFETRFEAEAVLKYISGKFSRTLLGTLKITQHNKRDVWANVPLQDFTSSSDIDWTQSIADIDKQLYAKYGLDDEEIAFIESHVKEMD